MPDPQETLAVFAEVAIALAGFSGIVIAFGQRAIGTLSRLELRRLSNLFSLSGIALVAALLASALLYLQWTDPNALWQWGSAALFIVGTPWVAIDIVRVSRLEAAEQAEVNKILLWTFNSMAFFILALQLANTMWIAKAWPFFAALVLIICGAFQQFILLVRMGINHENNKSSEEK